MIALNHWKHRRIPTMTIADQTTGSTTIYMVLVHRRRLNYTGIQNTNSSDYCQLGVYQRNYKHESCPTCAKRLERQGNNAGQFVD